MKKRPWALQVKRYGDQAAASMALVCLAPVLLGAGLAIACTMGRPLLFRQQRLGIAGKPFTLYKLRTMRAEAGPVATGHDAARLTTLGRWLRSSSIDELPQLWNVLRGDMSLVGPRPLLLQYRQRYTKRQAQRHNVLPGITGWAQVHGRNALSWEQKFELDVWYVEHWSLALDVRIAWQTIGQLWRIGEAHSPGHVTMAEFMGSAASP